MDNLDATSTTPPSDRTVLVTGGTFGIGRATAVELARQGLTVVITGRDAARAQATVADIGHESGNSRISYLLADLSRPAEVHALAQAFSAQYARLDVLLNNAGGTFRERKLTADGFERTWALNHLAYVQLTLALLPLLAASRRARIVNVASSLYARKLDFTNLQSERRYSTLGAYAQSKLANHLFTYALARRLAGTGVTVNAVNPGLVDTGLRRDAKGVSKLIGVLLTPIKKTPRQGAFPSVYMATSAKVEGVSGRFFDQKRFIPTAPATRDEALQERLWQVSLEQLDIGDIEPGGAGQAPVVSAYTSPASLPPTPRQGGIRSRL